MNGAWERDHKELGVASPGMPSLGWNSPPTSSLLLLLILQRAVQRGHTTTGVIIVMMPPTYFPQNFLCFVLLPNQNYAGIMYTFEEHTILCWSKDKKRSGRFWYSKFYGSLLREKWAIVPVTPWQSGSETIYTFTVPFSSSTVGLMTNWWSEESTAL